MLIAGAIAASALIAVRVGIPRISQDGFAFEPIESVPGFRRLAGGELSLGSVLLSGLDTGNKDALAVETARARADPCTALFENYDGDPDIVPIAYFSDYSCPFCRVLTPILAEMAESTRKPVHVSWHELPLLGERSQQFAIAALAAKRQGAYETFHQRAMQSQFQPTRAYLSDLAERIGIDPQRFFDDFQSPEIARAILKSRALAQIFGFVGTPSLVVGRTARMGSISKQRLVRLIAQERKDGPVPGCEREV